jgi:hypothetical protein
MGFGGFLPIHCGVHRRLELSTGKTEKTKQPFDLDGIKIPL